MRKTFGFRPRRQARTRPYDREWNMRMLKPLKKFPPRTLDRIQHDKKFRDGLWKRGILTEYV